MHKMRLCWGSVNFQSRFSLWNIEVAFQRRDESKELSRKFSIPLPYMADDRQECLIGLIHAHTCRFQRRQTTDQCAYSFAREISCDIGNCSEDAIRMVIFGIEHVIGACQCRRTGNQVEYLRRDNRSFMLDDGEQYSNRLLGGSRIYIGV